MKQVTCGVTLTSAGFRFRHCMKDKYQISETHRQTAHFHSLLSIITAPACFPVQLTHSMCEMYQFHWHRPPQTASNLIKTKYNGIKAIVSTGQIPDLSVSKAFIRSQWANKAGSTSLPTSVAQSTQETSLVLVAVTAACSGDDRLQMGNGPV